MALTGLEATSVFSKGAIQESGAEGVNITNIFQNFTKYSGTMVTEKRAEYMVQKAIRLALSDRNRPTHLSLPADVMKRKLPNTFSCALPSEIRVFDRKASRMLLPCCCGPGDRSS